MTSSLTKPSSLVTRRLYRNLLRAVKPFTAPSPNARILNCLLHRTGMDDHIDDWEGFVSESPDPAKTAEDQARDLSFSYTGTGKNAIPPNRTYEILFRRLLREVVAGRPDGIQKLNFPSQVDATILRTVVRREFRDGPNSQSIKFDPAARQQVVFTALQELHKKLSYYDDLQRSSPEPLLPQQAASNVSALPFSPPSSYLRPGTFLVSHPHMNDSFFTKAVICILEHKSDDELDDESAAKLTFNNDDDNDDDDDDDMPRQATYGLIINRASINVETGKNRPLKEAFDKEMLPARLSDVFGDSMVREGGPVHVAIQMVHSLSAATQEHDNVSAVGGTLIPVIPDADDASTALYSDRATYFQGDILKAMAAVEEGALDRDDVSFFVGASTWEHGQLEHEIEQGFWIPCRGPPEMALTGICEHEPTNINDNSGKRPLADLWLSMLSAAGDDEAKLAHWFYHEEWDENGLPCDSFDDDDIDLLF